MITREEDDTNRARREEIQREKATEEKEIKGTAKRQ